MLTRLGLRHSEGLGIAVAAAANLPIRRRLSHQEAWVSVSPEGEECGRLLLFSTFLLGTSGLCFTGEIYISKYPGKKANS